jgi:hypothetical protein
MAEAFAVLAGPMGPASLERVRRLRLRVAELVQATPGLQETLLERVDETALLYEDEHTNDFALAEEYLKGLTADNLVLMNPLDVLVIAPGRHTLCLHLATTDRSFNEYPPLVTPGIDFDTGEELRVAVYSLFREAAHA